MNRVTAGPTPASERVEELDVLRGVALFGVFLVNMVGFTASDIIATEQQLLSLPTAALDHTLLQLIAVLFNDKANTLFAFLFGLGFHLQMQRAQARGAAFERIYVRRLTVLLCLGVLHALLLWTWDILHLYAMAGFVLLALRRLSTRSLLVGGVLLTLVSHDVGRMVFDAAGLTERFGIEATYTDEAILLRQQLSIDGNYWGLVGAFAHFTWLDYLLSGLLIGWLIYAVGRFMLGAWVGRKGWLQHANQYLPGFRRVLRIALPLGLLLEAASRLASFYARSERLPEWDHWELVAECVHHLALPILSAGYLCAVVVGLHHPSVRSFLTPFAHVGRMALTNYVAQSFVIALVLFGVWPGLALAGRIGTTYLTLIVVVAFVLQILASRWWLARYAFGPLEWVWRGLTYGTWPALRRGAGIAPAREA